MARYEDFTEKPRCVKCGCEDEKITHWSVVCNLEDPEIKEYLLVRCKKCGYGWRMLCMDHGR